MATTNFSVAHCKTLKFTDAIAYIEQFFIPLDDGTHAFRVNEQWEVRDDDVVKRVFFNRLSPLLNDWYFKEYDHILTPIHDKTKPEFIDGCINFDFKKDNLPLHYQFIVDDYIRDKTDMDAVKPNDLYQNYKTYVACKSGTSLGKTEFIDGLATAGIVKMKSGTFVYKYSYDELYQIGVKNQWVFEDKRDIEIRKLKLRIEGLNKQLQEMSAIQVVDEDDEDVEYEYVEVEVEETELENEVVMDGDDRAVLVGEDLCSKLL